MVNMLRIFAVLFTICALLYGANYTYNWYNARHQFTPIDDYKTPSNTDYTVNNFQERLNAQYNLMVTSGTIPINTPSITPSPTPTEKPLNTLKPTEKSTITPTLKPVPQERTTDLKSGDYDKILPVHDGIESIGFAIDTQDLYLGKQYYYVGDYAVFTMKFLNILDKTVSNPKVIAKVYKSGINIYSYEKQLELSLNPNEKSDIQYFDITIPNSKGFFTIIFDVIDKDTNKRLCALHKEINIL
jgi:hypothetical protein